MVESLSLWGPITALGKGGDAGGFIRHPGNLMRWVLPLQCTLYVQDNIVSGELCVWLCFAHSERICCIDYAVGALSRALKQGAAFPPSQHICCIAYASGGWCVARSLALSQSRAQ
jgi:hypothetical protein